MNFRNILILIALIGLGSCQWGKPGKKTPAITKDTLAYSYQTFKERAPDCGDKPDSGCTVVKIKYPDFSGQKALNDSVTVKFNKLFGDDKKPDTSLKQVAENFMAAYNDFRKERPKSTLFFLLDGKAKVLRQDSSLTAIEVTGYSYTGGAHGVSYTYFINWDTKTGKNVRLSDILKEGYEAELNHIAEHTFRTNERIRDTSSLNNMHDYFFAGGKFSLPDNYLITPLGIKFLYNVYTIKPYAAGPTNLVVPYAQIKSLIKPNTVISQFAK